MKSFLVVVALMGIGKMAAAAPIRETFPIRLYPSNLVECTNGVAANGHNYPGNTTLSFTLQPWEHLNPVFFNSTYFHYATPEFGAFCERFKNITGMPNSQSVVAIAQRQVWDSYRWVRPDQTLRCVHFLREEMRITIAGVPFDGATEFYAGFVDDAQCGPVPR